jgi:hypothetical protein
MANEKCKNLRYNKKKSSRFTVSTEVYYKQGDVLCIDVLYPWRRYVLVHRGDVLPRRRSECEPLKMFF